MKLKWKDEGRFQRIAVTFVSDDDANILRAVGYFPCEDEDYEDDVDGLVEVWRPITQINHDKIGKWVAFKQEGMKQILHGKVFATNNSCIKIKCKNGQRRYISLEDCYKFFDSKSECYNFKEELL